MVKVKDYLKIFFGYLCLILSIIIFLTLVFKIVIFYFNNRSNHMAWANLPPEKVLRPLMLPQRSYKTEFLPTQTVTINDFNFTLGEVIFLKVESDKHPDYCLLPLKIFNFSSSTALDYTQFKMMIENEIVPLDTSLIKTDIYKFQNYEKIETLSEKNFNLYFPCKTPNGNFKLEILPIRQTDIKLENHPYEAFSEEKQAYISKIIYSFKEIKNLKYIPNQIPLNFSVLDSKKNSLNSDQTECQILLEIRNFGQEAVYFDDYFLVFLNQRNEAQPRLLSSSESLKSDLSGFSKSLIHPNQKISQFYSFLCNQQETNFTLEYKPVSLNQDFLDQNYLSYKFSILQ